MASSFLAKTGRRPGVPHPRFEPATAEQKRIFLKHYRNGLGVGEARKKAELDWAHYKHALSADEEFLAEHQNIDSFLVHKLQGVAESLALKGDGPMVRWLLEKLHPEMYGKKSEVAVTHRIQSYEDIKGMSDKDLQVFFTEMGAEPPEDFA